MFEKVFNIIVSICFIIYLVIALLFSLIGNVNILFKGWYLLLLLIPSISGLLFHKNKLSNMLLILVTVTIYLTIVKVFSINKCFIILACLGIIYIGIDIVVSNLFVPNRYSFNRSGRFYWSLFSETKDIVSNTNFDGGTIYSFFGTTTLDIYQSKLDDNSVIKVISIFGSSNIIVPENSNVILSSTNIIGDSRIMVKNKANKKAKNIYVNSITLLGSLKIR